MFARAVSPVIRLEDPAEPVTASAGFLARARALPPGPAAILQLSLVDADTLDDVQRTELLETWERCSRWVAAQQARAVVAVAGPIPADRDDFAREYVRAALVDAGGSPRAHVDLARALVGPLRPALEALEGGELSYDAARALEAETAHLDPATAGEVATAVLPAGRRTPAEFRRRVRRAVIAADPLGAELRAARATRERRVIRRVEPDAQASLGVHGPATDVATIWTALDLRAARAAATDDRTLDQRRFDALVELCRDSVDGPAAGSAGAEGTGSGGNGDGGDAGSGDGDDDGAGVVVRRGGRTRQGLRPGIYLFADAATWAGLADEPVDLEGYGPIPAGVARACFTDAQWRAVVTDALGKVESVSDRAYRPTAATRRHLHVQDRRCAFPGCAAAIWFCDADHNTPHACGGPTDTTNCGLLCRRHHRLKTFTRWQWTRDPHGDIQWTDPHGRTWA